MFFQDYSYLSFQDNVDLNQMVSCVHLYQLEQVPQTKANNQCYKNNVKKQIEKQTKDMNQNDQQKRKHKIKKQKNVTANFQIEYPLKSELIYHICGNILTELNPHENNYYQISIRQLVKTDQYYQIYPQNIRYLSDLEQIIFLLQNSQCQDSYNASLLLQQYQILIQNQKEICKRLKQEINEEEQLKIRQQMNQFKEEMIKQHIEQNLKDEHFYIISSINLNLNDEISQLEHILFSKGLFYILGINQNGMENILLKYHLLFLMVQPEQRKLHFVNQIQRYLNANLSKQVTESFFIQTLDQIKIICNLINYTIPICYPQNLIMQNFEKLNSCMDNIQVTIFNIPVHQIQKVLDQRQVACTDYFEDFEYQMLSQIFLEKFYPNKFDKKQAAEQKRQKQHQQQIKSQKRASFKLIKL